MRQLKLNPEQLDRIGFKKKRMEDENRYAIDFINGCFYYNPNEVNYVWYQRVDVNGEHNHVHLNIVTLDDLFQLLSFFQIKFNFIKL